MAWHRNNQDKTQWGELDAPSEIMRSNRIAQNGVAVTIKMNSKWLHCELRLLHEFNKRIGALSSKWNEKSKQMKTAWKLFANLFVENIIASAHT